MSKAFTIRVANKKDEIDCINLSKISWPNWWSKNEKLGKEHIRICIKEKRCLVALKDGETIGFLVWGDLWNKIHLQDIFVKERYRRKGIGTKLINQTIKISKNRGFREIVSDCDTNNKISVAFHLSSNFKKCGFIKKNWDNDDSYVFSKSLR